MSVFDSTTTVRMTRKLKPVEAVAPVEVDVPRTRLLKGESAPGKKKVESVFDELPTAAQRAFQSSDILGNILGMRRAFQRTDQWGPAMKKVMEEYYFDEGYDDGMNISTYTTAGPLLEQLRAGKLKATVSVPYGSFYGGVGSGNGNSIDMFRECVEATKHAFTVTESERGMTEEEYKSLFYWENIDQNKEELMEEKLAARDEDDDDDDVSIGLNTPPFEYQGTVTFVLVCKDEAARKEAIEWLELYDKIGESQ